MTASLTAKSGRRYHKIPDGYDVEEWDEMTPYQRLKALGLIEVLPSQWEKYDDEVDETRLGLEGEETWIP
jgi:hypothetical protein